MNKNCRDWTRTSYDTGFHNYGNHVSNLLTKNALKDKNFYSDKQEMYFMVLQRNPKDGSSLRNIGVNYENTGKFLKAKFFYEKALQLDPKNEQCQQDLKDAEKGISENMSSFEVSENFSNQKIPETFLKKFFVVFLCEKSGSTQTLKPKNYQTKQ